ncbi:MAG: TIGR02186 family protein [Deltaproteobacteria bacterium]|nr:TIGR02186 family protein [Deltaproteobacteria bacterium]
MTRTCAGMIMALMLLTQASLLKAEEPLQVSQFPDRISIGTFYNGTRISINGTLPADSEVVVRMTGEAATLRMKKKGKVFGLLWMNRDTVTFESVPKAFLLYTPHNFEDIFKTLPKDDPVRQLGLSALEEKITVSPDSSDSGALVKELLKLKKNEGIYAVSDNVHYTPPAEGRKKFEADIIIPPKLSPGVYKVEVFMVQNRTIVASYDHSLTVALESFPKILSLLAFDHGAMYGILATLIAVVAGLLTGVFFKGSKGAH